MAAGLLGCGRRGGGGGLSLSPRIAELFEHFTMGFVHLLPRLLFVSVLRTEAEVQQRDWPGPAGWTLGRRQVSGPKDAQEGFVPGALVSENLVCGFTNSGARNTASVSLEALAEESACSKVCGVHGCPGTQQLALGWSRPATAQQATCADHFLTCLEPGFRTSPTVSESGCLQQDASERHRGAEAQADVREHHVLQQPP